MLAKRLKTFARTMALVCVVMSIVILVAASQFASQLWPSAGYAIGATIAMSVCTVFTTKKTARLSGDRLATHWIFLDYLFKIVVLFVALSLTPDRVFGGFAAIASTVAIAATQIFCLFPRKKDPLLDSLPQLEDSAAKTGD